MTNGKHYEMVEAGTSGVWRVRCIETGTETIGMSKPRAARVLRALRGSPALHVAEDAVIDSTLATVFRKLAGAA